MMLLVVITATVPMLMHDGDDNEDDVDDKAENDCRMVMMRKFG